MRKQSLLLLLALTLTFASCSDTGNEPESLQLSSVYVINEGNFSQSNGSVTSFDPETGIASQNAFEGTNGRPFAGYIQTSTIIDDRLYIVSNMSNKIEVVDLESLSSVGTIALSQDPVAIAPAGLGEAYVTNLFGNSVTVLDLENQEETDQTIDVGANPYFAYNINGKVYISNNGFGGSNTVSVIDVASGTVENTITVGAGPKQIVEDASGQLWVICEGAVAYDENGNRDPENDTPGGIFIINPEQQTVVNSIENDGRPIHLAMDTQNSRAYAVYAGGDVAQINVNTQEMVDEDFIPRTFNTIAYSAAEELIYVGKSNGLTQPGQAIQYNLQGTVVDSFETGISPIEFRFVKN